ncbi:hypothetical protein BLA6993_01934 [Burkholderia lata]|uniref:Uncharacterized protein n=1 Tax=Burkholderia lata (strain ATCC 17760 / DSM 23089 / LMG 22485 / NCIMB 9086 / R18194 / 383) TaxID=482957 RepID=A0A833PVP5_BURL3|nr:MAG: hypothetical protein GAK33_03284 [Burkholderia lata]VWB43094.1 hypothetical protein BLA6993_01934 [Burkholderia lata]
MAFVWASAHVVDTPTVRVVTVYTFGFDVAVTSEAVEHAASKHAAAATVNHRKVRKETGVDMGRKRAPFDAH